MVEIFREWGLFVVMMKGHANRPRWHSAPEPARMTYVVMGTSAAIQPRCLQMVSFIASTVMETLLVSTHRHLLYQEILSAGALALA